MVGIGRFLEIRHVTTHAVRRGPLVPAAQVAGRTVKTGMGPRQSESGHFQVIERGPQPRRDRVALLATGRESRCRVVGPVRLSIRRGMTRIALERKTLKLTDSRSLVATITLQGGVPANQRKTIFVIPHRLNCHPPPLHVVAALAIRAHLAVVDIRVTIPAPRAGIGKNRLGVTLRARHVLVHAAQRVAGFGVIEFRNSAYRFPSKNGMAILARNIQVTVRTARGDGAASLRSHFHGHVADNNSGKST